MNCDFDYYCNILKNHSFIVDQQKKNQCSKDKTSDGVNGQKSTRTGTSLGRPTITDIVSCVECTECVLPAIFVFIFVISTSFIQISEISDKIVALIHGPFKAIKNPTLSH